MIFASQKSFLTLSRMFIKKLQSLIASDLFKLSLMYFLSYGLIILNNGYYWDDWCLLGQNPQSIIEIFKQAGTPWAWTGHYFNLLFSFDCKILIFRLITFFTYFFSGIFLYKIICRISEIDPKARFFITSFFLLLPMNSSRIILINGPAGLCHFLFFFAFFLIATRDVKVNYAKEVFLFLLFLVSFNVQSILVFYFVTIMPYCFYQTYTLNSEAEFRIKIFNFFQKNYHLIFAPFIFFIFKTLFWQPSKIYASYNKITFENIKYIFILLPETVKESTGVSLSFYLYLSIFLFLLNRFKYRSSNQILLKNFLFLLLGFILFWAAIAPYLLVKKVPSLTAMESRHQLLIPLGLSIILYSLIKLFEAKYKISKFLIKFLPWTAIVFFIIQNNIYNFSFYKDYLAQIALEVSISHKPDLFPSHSKFIFNEKIKLWANKREINFYEISGILGKVFNEETRFGSRKEQLKYSDKPEFHNENYNLQNFKPTNSIFNIQISKGENISRIESNLNVLKLMIKDFCGQDIRKDLQNVLVLNQTK